MEKNANNKIHLGDKYYRFLGDEEEPQIIRIIKMKNTNTFVVEEEKSGDKYKIDKSVLDDFTKLIPDGYISFAIVNLEADLKDTIIALYRQDDLRDGNTVPFAACRQNIFDLFSNQIKRKEFGGDDIHYVGMSMSKDTVPEGVQYEMILACNGVSDYYMVSVYIDDSLDKILSLVREKKYDIILQTLKNKMTATNIYGNCTTLRQLLEENGFMYDFHSAFKITEVPFEVKIMEETNEIIPEQRIIIEDILKVEMFKTYILKYDKGIDLKKIQREHILISDLNDNLYVLAYDKGAYINRYYQQHIKDKRDVVAMLKYRKNNGNK